MWAYAAQEGRYGDASAYYSSLGGVWDAFWLFLCVANMRVFSTGYFEEHVEPNDPLWAFLRVRLGVGIHTMVVIFRAYALYGVARVLGWFLWARLVNPLRSDESFDPVWGGPSWVEAAPRFQQATSFGHFVLLTAIGAAGTCAVLGLLWRMMGRRAWERAGLSLSASPLQVEP